MRRIIAWTLLAITILMILFCGMFPFDFAATRVQRFDLTLDQWWTAGDGPENVVFFLPFGFALGLLLRPPKTFRFTSLVSRCGLALLLSAALSSLVELSQMFLASRDPSLSDVTANTIGGVLGWAMTIWLGAYVMRPLLSAALLARRVTDARIYGIAAVAWMALILLIPVHDRKIGSLANWDPTFAFLVGNEVTMDRPWRGTIEHVWLGSRTLEVNELRNVLVGADPARILGNQTVANYHFDGTGPYPDQTGHCGTLAWTTNSPDTTGGTAVERKVAALGGTGVPISHAWWLRTPDAGAAYASRAIAATDSFTIVCDVATDDLAQDDGDPRIVSISLNRTICDVQLIQKRNKLRVRVRTRGIGSGGNSPEFIAPGIFTEMGPRRIVVTYDHGQLLVTCDHTANRYVVHLTPESWRIWRIYPRSGWVYRMDSPGQSLCSLMYRGLAMLPLGLLLGAMAWVMQKKRGREKLAMGLAIGGIIGGVVLLEALLFELSHIPPNALAPIAGIFAAAMGGVAILHGTILPKRRKVQLPDRGPNANIF